MGQRRNALIDQLGLGGRDLGRSKVRELETLHSGGQRGKGTDTGWRLQSHKGSQPRPRNGTYLNNAVLAVGASDRERKDNAWRDAVGPVRADAHRRHRPVFMRTSNDNNCGSQAKLYGMECEGKIQANDDRNGGK